jgi:4-amino-4-deoxy-L-arabinose transferase-like glycosyltransferase
MLELGIALGILILSMILIKKNLKLSFYILIVLSVLLHKELFSLYRWDLLPVRVFMFAYFLMSVWFVFSALKNQGLKATIKRLWEPFLLFLGALWLVRGASIAFSKNLTSSVFLYAFFSTIFVLSFYLFYTLRNNPDQILKYLRFYIYLAFGLTVFGYFQIALYFTTDLIIGAFWNIPGNIPRVGATFWDVNHYASMLAALLPVLGIFILTDKGKKRRIFNIVMFVSMTLTLFLTSSRTSWIMAFVSFVVFCSLLLVKRVGVKGIWVVVGTLMIITLPMVKMYSIKDSPFRAKVKHFFHYRLDSFASHFMLLTGAYQVFEEYPILGGGYGSFYEHFSKTEIAPTFFGRDPAALNTRVPAHTIWGELLAETGILGLTSFVLLSFILLGSLLFVSLKTHDLKDHLMSAAMFSAVVGWFTAGIFYSYNAEFFWIILVLYYAYAISKLLKDFSYNDVLKFFATSPRTYTILIWVIAGGLIFLGLGTNHLIPWDEAIYAKIAKNMVTSGQWISQAWSDKTVAWFEKPPLFMWFMAILMKYIGFSSWAARLPSAIAGFLTVILTYKFAKKFFGKTVGFISAFSLVTTVHFLYYSRAAMLDVTATFFTTLCLYLYYFSREKQSTVRYVLIGAVGGLSVMTKGVVGLLPFVIIGAHELYLIFIKKAQPNFKSWKFIALGAAVIALPWHIEMLRRYGMNFLGNYLGYHVLERATSPIEDKGRPFWWYISVMRVSMRIWFISFVPGFALFVWRSIKRGGKYFFLLAWFVLVFLVFSISKSKLVWYIIPLYPAVSIMSGLFITEAYTFLYNKLRFTRYVLLKSLFVFAVVVFGLSYLFIMREMVYTSDTTGPPARLLALKSETFGDDEKIYIDRLELPLALYYTDGPFSIIDFRADREDRVPVVAYHQNLILLTKLGRYSDTVFGFDYAPKIIKEDGDWILWYFESGKERDKERVKDLMKRREELDPQLSTGGPDIIEEYGDISREIHELEEKLGVDII